MSYAKCIPNNYSKIFAGTNWSIYDEIRNDFQLEILTFWKKLLWHFHTRAIYDLKYQAKERHIVEND